MTRTILRGLSWGHRRATGPLVPLTAAFSRRHPDISVEWTVRPLSDFEHQGLRELASVYDLIIYDHPFSGSIVEAGVFEPLTDLADGMTRLDCADRYAGASLVSYRLGGTVWGLPIDAATQHAIYRADLMDGLGESVPQDWSSAIALGRRVAAKGLALGLAVKSPHALLTIASLMANSGRPWATDPDSEFTIDRSGFVAAYELVQQLLRFCPAEAPGWNAIDLHDAMTQTDDVVYSPCVYGYGTYGESDHSRRLSFGDFAGAHAPFFAGSTLGGTALAISRASSHRQEAKAFLAYAATDEAQCQMMASRHGQPALKSAWHDVEIDRRFNGFFSNTRRSIETAWIRPRHRGYIPFQAQAGNVVAESLQTGAQGPAVWRLVEPLMGSVNT